MNKLDILITEDDAAVARLLAIYLDGEGYAVRVASSVKAMQDAFTATTPDLMILDVMLPDGDGWGALRWLRARSQLPVMMLTGKGDVVDKVVGLELGADDYLAKPFDLRELLARLRNIQRRVVQPATIAASAGPVAERFEIHGLVLDTGAQQLRDGAGYDVKLTQAEYRILLILARSPGQVVTRDRMMEDVAGRNWDPNDRSLDVHVSNLRKKLEIASGRKNLIRTVRGAGYLLPLDASPA